jgi:hypothetical protein
VTTHLRIALWGVLPYLALAVLVSGTAWRYRYDRFGFTTRSSQLHESRLLKVGGPLFHYALFLVIGGHVMGLLVPEAPPGTCGSARRSTTASPWPWAARRASRPSAVSPCCCTGGCGCPPCAGRPAAATG